MFFVCRWCLKFIRQREAFPLDVRRYFFCAAFPLMPPLYFLTVSFLFIVIHSPILVLTFEGVIGISKESYPSQPSSRAF
jgi:hypothetical protein